MSDHSRDHFMAGLTRASKQVKERRSRELAQQELQALQDKIQPQLTFDEQVAKANALLVSLGVTPIIKADAQPDTPEQTPEQPQLSEEEQYQATITQSMIALIKQRKKR